MKRREAVVTVVKFVQKLCPSLFPLMIVSRMLNSAIPFISIVFSSRIIDSLVAGESYEQVFANVLWMLSGNSVCILVHQGLEKLVNVRSYNLQQIIWNEVAEKSLMLDYELLEKRETMEWISKARDGMQSHGGINSVCVMLARMIGLIVDIIYAIVLIIPVLLPVEGVDSSLWFFNSPIGILALVAVLAIQLFVLFRANKTMARLEQGIFEANVEGNTKVGALLDPIIQYAWGKDIRMIRQDFQYVGKVREIWDRVVRKEIDLERKGIKIASVNFFFATLFSIACYLYVGVKALLSMVTVGNVAKYVSAFTKLGVALGQVVNIYVTLQVNCSYLAYFVDFMNIENHKYDGTLPIEKRDDGEYEFEFRDVSFSYPNNEKPVLEHVSFKLKIGRKMALVGPNGAGKTTFIKLLCRLYDPTEGQILLNGIDIQYYDYYEYIKLFSVVFQDFKLFSFSIAENVAVSNEYDKEKVKDCLIKAGFSKRLEELGDGIYTNLFQLQDDGMEISGGEKQKIAIARALYKNAPIVIMDEPTSALDPVSEYEIYQSFDKMVKEKTAIYISHRMSSCRFCEQILVFEGGKIVQQGSHEDLVEDKSGLYYELWNAQAQYYQ